MSSNSYTLGQLKKIEKIVVKDDVQNVEKIVFPNNVQVGAGSQLPSTLNVGGEIKGYIHKLSDGSPYLIAGTNVTITSASNGQVTISSSGGGGSVRNIEVDTDGDGSTDNTLDSGETLVLKAGTNVTLAEAGGVVTINSSGGGGGGGGAVSAVANGADNRIATFSSADALNGEANLTFDGTDMTLSGDASLDGSIVINESGADKDFRVESANNQNMLIVKGSTDRVGIGRVSAPQANLHLKEVTPTFRIQRSNNGNDSTLEFAGSAGSVGASMIHLASSNDLVFSTHDGSVPQEILRLGGHQTSDVRQVILLSGSEMAASAMQPQNANDINFFVSGAIDSRETSTRGTTVFGGDVVISGSLFTLDNPAFVYLETSANLGSTPSGNPTVDLHFEWHDGGLTNNDIEDFRNSVYWKYFPHGGEIIKIYANGSHVGNGSASNPFTGQMKVRLFTFTDAMVADTNPHTAGVIGTMTASPSALSVTPDGGSSYKHRALFDFTGASVTGTFVIPPGQLAALSFQGIGSPQNCFNHLHIHVVYKRNLK